MAPISVNQLHSLYNPDRVLFNHLITKLSRNPAQSLLVMALWIWLEKIGYPSVILVLTNLCDPLINVVFNEADTCLRWLQLENVPIPNDGGLPLTRIAMRVEISLELFIRRRFTAIAGIKKVLHTTCTRIFTDILQEKFGSSNTSTSAKASTSTRTRARAHTSTRIDNRARASAITGTSQHFPGTPPIIHGFPHPLFCTRASARVSTSTSAGSGASTSTSLPRPITPLVVPGFPHPLFGNFTIPPVNFEEMDLFDPSIWANTGPHDDVTDDDKTMFLTFSRGYPVTEDEVRNLFTSFYGDCIKVLNMGKTREQALFATMVLNKVEQLDKILDGKFIAKFLVNRKHIWARKYERRD